MAQRLIEMVLREKDGGEVHELLKGHKVFEYRQVRLPDGEVLVRILLDAEQSEAVLDLLGDESYRNGPEDAVADLVVGVSYQVVCIGVVDELYPHDGAAALLTDLGHLAGEVTGAGVVIE